MNTKKKKEEMREGMRETYEQEKEKRRDESERERALQHLSKVGPHEDQSNNHKQKSKTANRAPGTLF